MTSNETAVDVSNKAHMQDRFAFSAVMLWLYDQLTDEQRQRCVEHMKKVVERAKRRDVAK